MFLQFRWYSKVTQSYVHMCVCVCVCVCLCIPFFHIILHHVLTQENGHSDYLFFSSLEYFRIFSFYLVFQSNNLYMFTFSFKIFSYIISLIIFSLLCTLLFFSAKIISEYWVLCVYPLCFFILYFLFLSYCSMSWEISLALSSNTSLKLNCSSKNTILFIFLKNNIFFPFMFSETLWE